MFIRNKDCAIASAAGLTAALWYTVANIVIFGTIKQWLPQAILMYAPQLAMIVQYVSFHGIAQDGSFAILYFLAGFVQILIATTLIVWIGAKVYRKIHAH